MATKTPDLNTQRTVLAELQKILENVHTSDDLKFSELVDTLSVNLTPNDVFDDEVLFDYAITELGLSEADDAADEDEE